jgi:5'-nucleotidase
VLQRLARSSRPRSHSSKLVAATALGLVAAPLALVAAPAQGVSTSVVVNEVYGGGGNTSATFQSDFVEIKNISPGTVSLGGLSLQYRSAGGIGVSTNVFQLPAIDLPAGQTFLVQGAAGSSPAPALATPDATMSINMSGTGGQIYLADAVAGVDPNVPAGTAGGTFVPEVIDFVGWGSSTTSFEGARASATTNPTSVTRNGAGADTDDNSVDLTVANPPTPVACAGCVETPPEEFTGTIAEIQGTGATTPHVGDIVTTTGVVTAAYPTGGYNGFVIQAGGTGGGADATPDASDAIFVWGGNDGFASYPAVGDSLEVKGEAVERGGPATGLTQIEVFVDADVVELETALDPVTPRSMALPATADEREDHESELVSFTGPFTVTNNFTTNRFAEIGLAAGTTPLIQPTEIARPGTPEYDAAVAANAARAVTLDDGASMDFLFGDNVPGDDDNQDIPLPCGSRRERLRASAPQRL